MAFELQVARSKCQVVRPQGPYQNAPGQLQRAGGAPVLTHSLFYSEAIMQVAKSCWSRQGKTKLRPPHTASPLDCHAGCKKLFENKQGKQGNMKRTLRNHLILPYIEAVMQVAKSC